MDKNSNAKSSEEICDISKIYSDKPPQSISYLKLNKLNQSKNSTFIANNMKTMDTNTNTNQIQSNSNKTSEIISYFNQDSSKIKCALCNYFIEKGEIIYHCNCETFIHSICYIKNQEEKNIKKCPKCNYTLTLGIYELNQPNNSLNTGARYYNTKNKEKNTSNKTSISANDKHGSINTNMLLSTIEKNSTNEKSIICMDTNINGLEDYDKLCDNAADIPLESMIEILNEKDKEQKNASEIKNDNKGLNIRSTLINMSNKNINSNKTVLGRVALSPITMLNTPYTCNKRKGLSVLTSIPNQLNNIRNINYSNNKAINVKRKLTFLSDTKTENKIIMNDIDKYDKNNTPNNSIINMSNSNSMITYSNNSPNSLRNLDFNDVTNEEINEEDNEEDKENNPPLLKENSKFVRNEESSDENDDKENENEKNNLEINISGGISHITSDKKKTVDIPITIEINTINSYPVNYSKETLLIFNTNELNLEQILLILRIFNDKMGNEDKIYSNIFKSGEGLTKAHINYILEIKDNNYTEIFKETEKINYEKISTLIEYAIDLSMNSLSNIFSVLLINDIDEINSLNCSDYSSELKRILNKLESSKVNLLKYFSITSIILDNQGNELAPKNKTKENVNFLSYLYDLSMMCMGFFYTPKNLDELIKSVYLYCSNLEQFSLLNTKLIIKGNQDPSVYLEALNYPINKLNHNDFEIIIGPLLKKEKKIINLIATVILNNPEINLILPLMDVSCEFLTKKNSNNNSLYNQENPLGYSNQNIFKERTDFYRLNIPIIPRQKKINLSYSVILRNIISKTAQRISKSIDLFRKNDYENALSNIYEAKDTLEKNLKNQAEFIKKIQMTLDGKTNSSNSNIIQNLNWNNLDMNNVNFSVLDNSSFDLNNNSMINSNNEKSNNLRKIGYFIHAVENDLNLCIDIIKNKNLRLICQLFAIQQSLSFYRVVIFEDNRFLEDNYLNMN